MIHTGYKLLVLTAAVFLMEAAGALAYEGPETSQERCAAYPLGPNDQIGVRGMNGEQINETLTVGADNEITVPLIGRMAVGGLTVEELQGKLNKLLKEYIQDPNVAVTLAAPQSRRVSIVGAVNQPGVHPIRGCTTIMEAISQAGGLRTDAGNAIKITRSGTPANQERSGAARPATKSDFEVIDLRVSDLLEAKRPENNVMLQPGDVVSVPRGQMVYVVGAVQKPGGFVLNERETISALQALSLAGGLGSTPSPQSGRIIRSSENGAKAEIPVNVEQILNGKHGDIQLQPDDILFIPSSTGKKAALRSVEAVIQTATGLAIWRR